MKLAQRIHLRQIETDAAYAELTAFLDRHRPCFDELTIFDGSLPPRSDPDERAPGKRRDLKKADRRSAYAGLSERRHQRPLHTGTYRRGLYGLWAAVCADRRLPGRQILSCFCPEHEDRKQFLREKYAMYAKNRGRFSLGRRRCEIFLERCEVRLLLHEMHGAIQPEDGDGLYAPVPR